ncbi:MAG: hypothetical protein ACREVC_00380 [Burkholderiales bacterium]
MSRSLALMGSGIFPLALLNDSLLFMLCSLLAGVTMAPPRIIQATYVAKTVATEHMTEGFTRSATAMLSGIAVGLTAGGVILEYETASHAIAFAAVCSLLAAAWAGQTLHLAVK